MLVTNVECVSNKDKSWHQFYLFYRDENNLKERKLLKWDKQFYPYFYVPEDATIEDKFLEGLLKVETGFVDYSGKPVKKLIFKSRENNVFMAARDIFSKTYEDDVVFLTRFQIDNGIFLAKQQRIMFIDIETNNSVDVENPLEVVSLAIYDSYHRKYICFVWREDLVKSISALDSTTVLLKFSSDF